MKLNISVILKPELVFLTLATIFGITFVVVTPPFQSPDENRHFYRAYHISQGSFSATKMDGRVGGYLPQKVRESAVPYSDMRGHVEKITSRKELASNINRKVDNTEEFVDFPSTAVYTPISYLPQALGIRIASLCSESPLMALYSGRLFVLFFWMVTIFYAIRIAPILKWMFVVLALLPMSLYISASLSSDTVTNGIVFLLLANLLKQAFTEKEQTRKDFLILGILAFLLASAKFIYSPLILLFFLIPLRNFKSKKQYTLRFLMLGILALCTTVCWPLIQGVGYVPFADYNADYSHQVNLLECSNVHDQLAYLMKHGSYLFSVVINSIVESFDSYAIGFIGNFGWGEAPLSSFWLVVAYIGLLCVALADGKVEARINAYKKGLVFGTFTLIFCLVIISQLLIWTCVGNDVVSNLQGRYFTPIGPLLFFLFYRSSETYSKFLPAGVTIFSLMLLIVSTNVVYERFYVPLEYSIETVVCDHEVGQGDSDFGTSDSELFAGNGFSRSNEKSRSGEFSSKLSSEINYGTLITLSDCNAGDKIEVQAWRSGPNGMVIISAGNGEKFYQAVSEVDSAGREWQQIRCSIQVPPAIKNEDFSCYLAYLDKVDSCYFDDIKIILKRKK